MSNDKKQTKFTIILAEEKDTKKVIEFISKHRNNDNTIKLNNGNCFFLNCLQLYYKLHV